MMAKFLSSQDIFCKVGLLCKAQKAVLAAYLFGSAVKKKGKKLKDIDIAILLDEVHAKAFLLPSFISALEKTLGCRVDVVVLNRAGEVIKYEVRRNGTLIFERSPELRKKFEIQSRKTYEDFLFLHRRYVNKVLYGS
jgi:predicted nucleotidyltransferase